MARILVLDYDKSVRAFVKIAFQSEGHAVFAFEDARTVLQAISFDDIDLVITDLNMPMPGDEVVSNLRERGIRIPILVTSPTLPEQARLKLLSLGAQEILVKPFNISGLLAAAGRYLVQPEILATDLPQTERLASYKHKPFQPTECPAFSPN